MNLLLVGIVVLCGATVVVSGSEGSLLSRVLHWEPKVTTTTPKPQRQIYINNNLPQVPVDCTAYYVCKKKLKTVPAPSPCVKFCLKRIECPNNQIQRGRPNECVELDEAQVLAENTPTTLRQPISDGTTTEKIMEVAMIDFPCQPGYLPDSRGRCREIW